MIADLQRHGDNITIPAMGGPERDVLSSDWMPPLYHATRQGRVFYLENQALTMATTYNTPLAAATGTPILGFQNPPTSKVNAVILYGWFANVSGTPAGQAHPVWNYAVNTAGISANPSGSPRNGLIGGPASAMRVFSGIALTGLIFPTGNVAAIRPFGVDTFAGAIAANGNNGSTDHVNGAIIVPPGSLIGLFAGIAAGTSWVVSASMAWMEVPI